MDFEGVEVGFFCGVEGLKVGDAVGVNDGYDVLGMGRNEYPVKSAVRVSASIASGRSI